MEKLQKKSQAPFEAWDFILIGINPNYITLEAI